MAGSAAATGVSRSTFRPAFPARWRDRTRANHFGLGGDWHRPRQRQAVPEERSEGEGFLLMPAGRNGPAFIVTPNFYVLKEYNESDLYALFIGHGADRIAHGDRGLPAIGAMSAAFIAPTSPACKNWRPSAMMSAARMACRASRRAARSATGRPSTDAPPPAFPTSRLSERCGERSRRSALPARSGCCAADARLAGRVHAPDAPGRRCAGNPFASDARF